MEEWDSEWQRKGATLSGKTAWGEFGLTQDEIVQADRPVGREEVQANGRRRETPEEVLSRWISC